jgi:hypothetical protein
MVSASGWNNLALRGRLKRREQGGRACNQCDTNTFATHNGRSLAHVLQGLDSDSSTRTGAASLRGLRAELHN